MCGRCVGEEEGDEEDAGECWGCDASQTFTFDWKQQWPGRWWGLSDGTVNSYGPAGGEGIMCLYSLT